MELHVDLLDEINFRQVERQKAFSWETNDETTSNPPQICARYSYITLALFYPPHHLHEFFGHFSSSLGTKKCQTMA